MDTLRARLIYARKRKGYTQEQLAQKVGCSQGTIGNLESSAGAKSQSSTRYLPKIAEELGVSALWLSEGDGEVADVLQIKPVHDVPVVGDVKGGADGFFEELDYPPGHGDGSIPYPTSDKNAYALRVRGDSMHPRYRAGEFIVVEPNVAPQPGEDVVVICKDGRKLLKTLGWAREGTVSLLSINNGYAPLTMDASEIDRMHAVAGTVPARALRKV